MKPTDNETKESTGENNISYLTVKLLANDN